MLGGGGQAKREAIATCAENKPLTVYKGFGGSADLLAEEDVPGATFIHSSH